MKYNTVSEIDEKNVKTLTEKDKQEAFIVALTSFSGAKKRWQERAKTGLNDMDLNIALRSELGISGGSSGRDILSVAYQGAGLKIWANWDGINIYEEKPIFEGKQTIAMARHIFAIPNPDDQQISLF